LKVDVRESRDAFIEGGVITVEGEYSPVSAEVYIHCGDNETLKARAESFLVSDGKTVIVLTETAGISGDITVELAVKQQTLFVRIFLDAGR